MDGASAGQPGNKLSMVLIALMKGVTERDGDQVLWQAMLESNNSIIPAKRILFTLKLQFVTCFGLCGHRCSGRQFQHTVRSPNIARHAPR